MEIVKIIYIVLALLSFTNCFFIGKDRGVYTPLHYFVNIVINSGLIYLLINL